MTSFSRSCLIFTSLSCLLPAVAMAQAPRPTSAEPARLGERLRVDEQRPVVSNEPVITLPEDQDRAVAAKVPATFVLTDIRIENVSAFTIDELRPTYEDYIGQQVSLATLNEIAAKITAQYRNAGYVLSRATVAPQRIQGGVVVFRIVEGFIDQVVFEGNKGNSPLLAEYAEKIRNSKPLNTALLERYLLLMEDLPGVSARATLRPSATTPGASDVVILLDERPVSITATVDNRGTHYMGPIQGGLSVSANNALGMYERTQLHGLVTSQIKELQYGQISHQQQLDSEGTKIDVSASYTHSDAGSTLKNFDVIGRDVSVGAKISHPFVRSRQTNVYGNIGFDVRQTTVDTLGTELYEDRLRVLRAGAAYDFVDSGAATNRIEGTISKGFDWDTDTDTSRSRATGNPSFVKINAEASRLQPIAGNFTAFFAASMQASHESLLSSEQFGIGGANFGSAYDPSEITGDSGVASRVELQYSRSGDLSFIPNYQLYAFYDWGQTWTRFPGAGQEHDQSLTSTGLGTRFNLSQSVSGGFEFAVPLTRRVAGSGTDGWAPRMFFNLGYQY